MTHDNKGLVEGRQHKTIGHSTGWLALKMDNVGGVFQHAEDEAWRQDSDIDGECPFARFGGVAKFNDLAFKTHAKMVHHPSLSHFFPETIDMEPITIKNARFMCGYFGGPKYGGPGVHDAHSFLKITHDQYDDFMEIFKKEIKSMRCHDRSAVREIVDGIECLRKQIVHKSSPARKKVAKPKGKAKGQKDATQPKVETILAESKPAATEEKMAESKLAAAAEPSVEAPPLPGLDEPPTPPPPSFSVCALLI